jgi:hypothetical protein
MANCTTWIAVSVSLRKKNLVPIFTFALSYYLTAPPTYEECEAKNFSSASIPEKTKTSPGVDKPSIFSRFQFEQLYRNLIYFAFYMFYRLKNSI